MGLGGDAARTAEPIDVPHYVTPCPAIKLRHVE